MNVASYIDHTILKPTTLLADITKLCSEARKYRFAAVCVPPAFIKTAVELLQDDDVKVATVAGFPFGYSTARAKLAEVEQAIEDGADELDVVANIAAIKNGWWQVVESEMRLLVPGIHDNVRIIKVIIESGVLTNEEIVKCCEIYAQLGVDFVKTSTGYADTGATIEAVQLMRANLPSGIRIKASGGIRTYDALKEFVDAGADRIGTSSGVSIVTQQISLLQ